MRHFCLVIILSLHVGNSLTYPKPDSRVNSLPLKYGSHNLLQFKNSNGSTQRSVRCTPCESDSINKRPISNQLNPEYRGNGADNLGYDWSPMAWGGLAFPQKSKMFKGGMLGKDGREMLDDWRRNHGNIYVTCDTCKAYWQENTNGPVVSGSPNRDRSNYARQFHTPNSQHLYGGTLGFWQSNNMMAPINSETRVTSPTVGVLVRPGSRIAYIPSRSGEMYWDGISGGGTRWDGFSNGISWIGSTAPEWDRSDSIPKEQNPDFSKLSSDSTDNSNTFMDWDKQKGTPRWSDNAAKGYYPVNGFPNQNDLQWKDRGYASNWHYGSTNQNGWNGNNMKWNYGGKQQNDNDRAGNRFYFNSPQDTTYGFRGNNFQYGNRYPNYQSPKYPVNFRPRPLWPPNSGYRVNDRDPSNFQLEISGNGNENRPWDYTSGDSFGYQRPRPRPNWPGSSYSTPGDYDKGSPGKFYPYQKYSPGNKFSADKNDYDKPWNLGFTSHQSSKPNQESNFPYIGNHSPGEGSSRPNFPNDGNLFFPNDESRQPSYPSTNYGSGGGKLPTYPSISDRPGRFPSAGNQIGNYPNDNGRPPTSEGKPLNIYTGGRPFIEESSLNGYISSGSSSAALPGEESSNSGYPNKGSSSGGYFSGESRPSGYRGSSSHYPSGENSSGKYPEKGSRPSGYPGSSIEYISGGNSGRYPSAANRPSRYPGISSLNPNGGNSYPDETRTNKYSSGGTYFIDSSQPGGFTSNGGRPDGYLGGSTPFVQHSSGGSFPYPSGINRPSGYPNEGSAFYPFAGSQPIPGEGSGYPEGYSNSKRPGEYYPGGIKPGKYPDEGKRPDGYSSVSAKPLFPIRNQPSYTGGGSGPFGGLYPQGGKNPPKGYYTGYITEIDPNNGYSSYGERYPNYFGGSYPSHQNRYSENNNNHYFYGEGNNRNKHRYPSYVDERYYGSIGNHASENKNNLPAFNRGPDRFYFGQNDGKEKYPGGYVSNTRYPVGSGDYNGNSDSSADKNSWNYSQNEQNKDEIYRRSGGSYPPYRGGHYYTSSYLASMTTISESTQPSLETKTQSMTKIDEVTQPTSES